MHIGFCHLAKEKLSKFRQRKNVSEQAWNNSEKEKRIACGKGEDIGGTFNSFDNIFQFF